MLATCICLNGSLLDQLSCTIVYLHNLFTCTFGRINMSVCLSVFTMLCSLRVHSFHYFPIKRPEEEEEEEEHRRSQDFCFGGGHPVDAVETTTPVVSTFSTSIRLLSSFFIKHCILPPPFSLSFCPSICLSSLSVVPHPVFLISGLSCGLEMLMFSSCNPKFFAVSHIF